MIRRPEPLRTRRARRGTAAAIAVGVIALVVLAGCTAAPSPSTSHTATTTSAPASPSPTPTPEPTLDPEGSADGNLPYFTAITAAVWASGDKFSGRAYIDALVAAGFDKSAMQVTPDTSTVGNPAESIQFAVAWGEDCLIGQVGPAIGDPVAIVAPALADGGCLVGETRPIDW